MSTPIHAAAPTSSTPTDSAPSIMPPKGNSDRPGREQACRKNRAFLFRLGLSAVFGGSLGYAYYYFVGCSSGHCIIGANPYLSALFGGLFGLNLAALLFPTSR